MKTKTSGTAPGAGGPEFWTPADEVARQGTGETLRPSAFLAAPPKILLYSHDTFGLGNIRRTLLLSEELIAQYPGASILIVTGSPMIHAFRIPKGIDYIKLPCLYRVDVGRYAARFLVECTAEVRGTRSAILRESVLGFDPDLMIVDKSPAGVDGELLEALVTLRQQQRRTTLVLGVRDILDEPERTRRILRSNGSFETIDRFYDEVWIYGQQSIFDMVAEYAFPESVASKTKFCGYLKRPISKSSHNGAPPHILVTTGGGDDGSNIIEAYLAGLCGLPRSTTLRTTVVFGPQMPAARCTELLERFGCLADVTFLEFEPDLTKHYAESSVVVSQAGYNTVCELLSFSRRAILIPRAEPVCEQLIRARLLAARGYFDILEPQDLTPDVLISKVLTALQPGPFALVPPDLDGLLRVRERVRALLREKSLTRRCASSSGSADANA